MIIFSAGFDNSIINIFLILLIMLILIILIKKYIFKTLAIINKMILPSLIYKDLSKLKVYEKLILGYRYWVTKNSL